MPSNDKTNNLASDESLNQHADLPGSTPEGTTEAILKGIENRNVESTMEEYFLKYSMASWMSVPSGIFMAMAVIML